MDANVFAHKFPRLYHLTFAANLPSIRTHGLLSAAALADAYNFSPEDRQSVLHQRRVCIQDLHGISIRDQLPAPESRMKTCLVNISIPEWLTLLNSKIFFFLSREKATRLLAAYTDYDNLLLEVDTAALLATHATHAFVSRINTGAFIYKPVPRGRASFIPLAQYEPRRKNDTPAELTIDQPIPNLLDYATAISTTA